MRVKRMIAVLTVGILLGLGAGGVLLYAQGKAAVAAGTREAIFTRDACGALLKLFLIPGTLLAALIILAAALKIRTRETEPFLPDDTADSLKRRASVCAHRDIGKRGYALLLAAAALIAAGILNGGLRDVLIKAIQICTECIGLG